MKLTDILAALPSLSADERAAIVSAIKALTQLEGKALPAAPAAPALPAINHDAELLLEAICDFMRDRGLEFSSSQLVKRTDGYRAFLRRSDFVPKWLEPSKLSRVEKRLFLAQMMPVLYEYLTWGQSAIGMKQMLLNAYKLPAVVEVQLPGYAKRGLLRLTIRREVKDVRS